MYICEIIDFVNLQFCVSWICFLLCNLCFFSVIRFCKQCCMERILNFYVTFLCICKCNIQVFRTNRMGVENSMSLSHRFFWQKRMFLCGCYREHSPLSEEPMALRPFYCCISCFLRLGIRARGLHQSSGIIAFHCQKRCDFQGSNKTNRFHSFPDRYVNSFRRKKLDFRCAAFLFLLRFL